MSQSQPSSIRWTGMVLLCLLGLTPAVPAAEEAQLEALKQQLEALQLRVQRLEEEIEKGVPVNRARHVQPVPGGWRKEANWKLLYAGMSDFEVIEILGEPDEGKTVKKFEFWEYGDGKATLYMHRLKSWEMPGGIDPN